jgi:hypothetical protein
MTYVLLGDLASPTNQFTGRCPLTGRFLSAVEHGDDEPLEHYFGAIVVAHDSGEDDYDNDYDDEDLAFSHEDIDEPLECVLLAQDHDDAHDRDWVEATYRDRFPHLWGEPEVNEEMLLDHPDGTYGGNTDFGHKRTQWKGFPGRRGHDDGRKQRKAIINRFCRSLRHLRTISA